MLRFGPSARLRQVLLLPTIEGVWGAAARTKAVEWGRGCKMSQRSGPGDDVEYRTGRPRLSSISRGGGRLRGHRVGHRWFRRRRRRSCGRRQPSVRGSFEGGHLWFRRRKSRTFRPVEVGRFLRLSPWCKVAVVPKWAGGHRRISRRRFSVFRCLRHLDSALGALFPPLILEGKNRTFRRKKSNFLGLRKSLRILMSGNVPHLNRWFRRRRRRSCGRRQPSVGGSLKWGHLWFRRRKSRVFRWRDFPPNPSVPKLQILPWGFSFR